MKTETPYHSGELRVQELSGEAAIGARNARVVGNALRPGSVRFLEHQSMAILASVDGKGAVWASLLLGETGFVRAVGPRDVEIDLRRAFPMPEDPAWRAIEADDRLGMLLIELETRRRLRINGRVRRLPGDRLGVHVSEAYPNCPKYIQSRRLELLPDRPAPSIAPRRGTGLDPRQQRLVAAADTLFVASVAPGGEADASHRGGRSGFVEMLGPRRLRIPDYPGNSMFNTLGNLAVHPPSGLLFVDFAGGSVLQLTGRADLRWGDTEVETGGTGRSWDFEIDRWIEGPLPVATRWDYLETSPFNPGQPGPAPEAVPQPT